MSVDFRIAYFCAKATRPVYIEIPVEDSRVMKARLRDST